MLHESFEVRLLTKVQISPTVGFNIKSLEHHGYTLNMWWVVL
jgi:hypothetical protein